MTRRLIRLFAFSVGAAGVTFWLYRTFILDGSVMLFGQEMIDQSWQLREFAMSEIQAGRGLPLWNPYVFGGVPFVAILPGPVFYPSTLLYFAMPLFRAIGWTFVLHTWLAGIFAWFAARAMHLERWPSAVTGFAFMLTGFMISMNQAGHDGRMFTLALFPLAFALLEHGFRSGRIGWFLGMGLVVACQIFTPHTQMMYFSSLVLSLYALVRLIWLWRGEEGRSYAIRAALGVTAGFVAAAAIGMAQLLPTLELTRIAVRGGGETGYAFASSWALPPQELTALFLPDLMGSLGSYWGANPFKQHTEYVGAVTLVLAVFGLATFRRDRVVILIGGLAALCTLYALGASTPVHRVAYEVVPMISQLRAASLMMGPAAFFIALLAGFGWQSVIEAEGEADRVGWPWVIGLSIPVLLFGLAAAFAPGGLTRWVHTSWFPVGWPKRPGPEALAILQTNGWLLLGLWLGTMGIAYAIATKRFPREASLAVLALLVLDLARVDDRYISVITPAEAFAADPLVERLQADMDPVARVFQIDSYAPNEFMLHDIRSVTGMQNFRLEWTDRLLGGLGYQNLRSPALWPVFDIDYIVTAQQVETPLLEAPVRAARANAYPVAADGPHAWFPRRVEAAPDSAAALRRLITRADPAEFALVAGSGPAPEAGEGTARVTSFAPNEVVLDVDATRGGLMVVSETYHPSWRATVDGTETEVLRTDIALRGVVVPAGRHELRLTYSAGSVKTGLIVGGVALLLSVVTIALSMLRARRDAAAAASGAGEGGAGPGSPNQT
ncbi:MAG: hypothetical protein ACR2GQ_10995 [Gemmatimonadota bacterium]